MIGLRLNRDTGKKGLKWDRSQQMRSRVNESMSEFDIRKSLFQKYSSLMDRPAPEMVKFDSWRVNKCSVTRLDYSFLVSWTIAKLIISNLKIHEKTAFL